MKVELQHITKAFYGVNALEDVEISLRSGEIHCLVGENGAGKSTLIKILAGYYIPEHGNITIDGRNVVFQSPRDSQKNKIAVIHQELLLVPELTAAENIVLGSWPKGKNGLVSTKKMNEKAKEVLERLGANIRPEQKVSSLSTGEQQLVEIAKALSRDIQLLILDEPTASLSEVDANNLLQIVQSLKKQGIAILYVSHRLEEVFAIADQITVFRDGKYIACKKGAETGKDEIVRLMVGREVASGETHVRSHEKGEIVLEVKGLTSKGVFADISFQLRAGEVLGLAGLVGAGRSEVLRAIFGQDSFDGGSVFLYGNKTKPAHPCHSMKAGIALVPEDRRAQGLVTGRSVKDNIALPILRKVSRYGFMSKKKELDTAGKYRDRLSIKTASLYTPVTFLSGGNQQKVVLARSLAADPQVLMLDEPTRGVDIGAREEIHKLIDEAVKENLAVLLVSSDILELLSLSDRVVVLKNGRIAGEFNDNKVSKEEVIGLATG